MNLRRRKYCTHWCANKFAQCWAHWSVQLINSPSPGVSAAQASLLSSWSRLWHSSIPPKYSIFKHPPKIFLRSSNLDFLIVFHFHSSSSSVLFCHHFNISTFTHVHGIDLQCEIFGEIWKFVNAYTMKFLVPKVSAFSYVKIFWCTTDNCQRWQN